MARRWDVHDFDDPDENPITRFRHLGGDYGPHDPAHWDFDDDDDDHFADWDSDDSFSHIPQQVYDDFEKEQAKHPRNPKDEVKRTPAGPVILLHEIDRFLPQWDEQILGPEWRKQRSNWDYDNPPEPLLPNDPKMVDVFKYCGECQLTWLVGYDKAEGHRHPHHCAWQPAAEHIDVHRWGLEPEASLVVWVRGGCAPEGQASDSPAGNPASTGAFFGAGSRYNLAETQGNESTPVDREKVDLRAIIRALCSVRYSVVEDRREILKKFEKSKNDDTSSREASEDGADKPSAGADRKQSDGNGDHEKDWEDSSEEGDDDDDDDDDVDLSFRVILVSDNKEVIDNICDIEEKQPARHADLYDRLDDMLDELEEVDVNVKWY